MDVIKRGMPMHSGPEGQRLPRAIAVGTRHAVALATGLLATLVVLDAAAGTKADYLALRAWCIEGEKHKGDAA